MLRYITLRSRQTRWFSSSAVSLAFNASLPRGPTQQIFGNDTWALQKPSLTHLPAAEREIGWYQRGGVTPFEFSLPKDNSSPYAKDIEFKQLLDQTLAEYYHTTVRKSGSDATFMEDAWLRLRDYIYKQLEDPQLPQRLQEYRPSVGESIQPSRPDTLLAQLYHSDKVAPGVWSTILKTGEKVPSRAEIYRHIVTGMARYIHEKEVVPQRLRTLDTDDTEGIDITNPSEWFPQARKIRRHVVLHLGPTNSGKTYRALQRLKSAESGYYAGPLRLLAREVYDRFKSEGIACNLLTGEEVIQELDAQGNPVGLTSGTVEMLPTGTPLDVVVLDEIQMMADPDRGWAWTNALLGACAREVHVCGEQSALPLIRKLVKLTGDKLTVNEYDRLGELRVESTAMPRSLAGLRKGDCVIAFSKKKILEMKLQIERQTQLKVAVIYGSLPPETRVQQAALFNNGECDVLVASDAVGMGLNLAIDRIVFTTDVKFNGAEMVPLTQSQIKQIGGRAGRFKSQGGPRPVGLITATDSGVLASVRRGIDAPVKYLDSAVIWPTREVCEQMVVRYPPGTHTAVLLDAFAQQVERHPARIYTLPSFDNMRLTLSLFADIEGLSFADQLRLSSAPVKDLPLVKAAFRQFCGTVARQETRALLSYGFPFELLDYQFIDSEQCTLEQYEALYHIIMLFFWLSNRYREYFIDTESARDLKYFCELIIFEKLDRLKRNPYMRGGAQGGRDLRALYGKRGNRKR